MNGALHIADATASTSPTTGALTVAGGVGVGGALCVSPSVQLQPWASDASYGAVTVNATTGAGMAGLIGKTGIADLNLMAASGGSHYFMVGGAIKGTMNASGLGLSQTTASTSPTTGALTVAGGVGIGGQLFVGGDIVGASGSVLSRASSSSTNSYFIAQDETAASRGVFYWDRPTNTVRMYHPSPAVAVDIDSGGKCHIGNGFFGRTGNAGAYGSNTHNFYWGGGAVQMWVDTSNVGNIAVACDYRIKKDVAPLTSTWDAVKALRPITYTQREFTPSGADKPLFVNDDAPRWGFVAHELQDVLLPSAASGSKDAENEIQSPNLLAVVAALTKALQEAMQRIEDLEAGG